MDKNKTAVSVFDKRANVYEEKFMNVDKYHNALSILCNYIKKQNAQILDVACGPGNIIKYLLQKRPDFKVTGIDLSPNMLLLAAKNNPACCFQLLDCRKISSLQKEYDSIICSFILPYLSKDEAVKLIHDSGMLLKNDGVLYISTMEGEYERSAIERSSRGDEVFIHYHEANYLITAINKAGLKLIDSQRIEYCAADGSPITDLVLIAAK